MYILVMCYNSVSIYLKTQKDTSVSYNYKLMENFQSTEEFSRLRKANLKVVIYECEKMK